ncbi:MAG: OmpA family protein [Tenacibaculum sp.]|nr:OmpA family protein [Tenacibaculum sp.]
MTKKLTYLLGILITILVGTYFSWKLCCNNNEKEDSSSSNMINNDQKKIESPTFHPFTIKDDNGSFSLSTSDNFKFESSSYKFLSPVTSNLDLELKKLKDYLSTNSKNGLSITGYYTEKESNKSAYPNLGFARAISVKNYLTSKGIPSNIMNMSGKLKEAMIPDSLNVFHGPVDFTFSELKDRSEELNKLGNYIKEHPLVLHFKTGETNINLTTEERQEMADIAKYLDQVEGAQCIVTGHTDNTGDATANLSIGQERANSAKRYLVQNGIPENKITAISKGQNEPIADNSTEKGKAENRRIVITIK